MAGLMNRVSGPSQTPAGRAPVPMGRDRSDQAGSLRGISEGAAREPRPAPTKKDRESSGSAQKIRNLAAEETRIPPGGPEPNDIHSLTYIREGKISIRSLPDILTMTVRLRFPVGQTWLPHTQPQRLLLPQSGGCLT